MCTVSFVSDGWQTSHPQYTMYYDAVGRDEFNTLKAELEALKKLLKAAKIYDDETGQPDCEMEEKVELIKRLADLVGVDLENIFAEHYESKT